LMWVAEPHLVERKAIGFRVLIFLGLFAVLMYLNYKRVWSGVKN
ncbi:MAG: cytochrome c1, partial [Cucumibacter sp.]